MVYVIAGEDDSLVGARCGELLDTLLEPSQRVTGLLDAEAASVSACEVLDELRTAPFLTDKRVVLIGGRTNSSPITVSCSKNIWSIPVLRAGWY